MRSAAVARGYSDGRDDGFIGDGGFLTGDYGAGTTRAASSLAGRVSSFVNVAGRKVQPDEVEQVLRTMPGVADVRVVGADDPRRGEQIVACIVAERAGTIRRSRSGASAPRGSRRTRSRGRSSSSTPSR